MSLRTIGAVAAISLLVAATAPSPRTAASSAPVLPSRESGAVVAKVVVTTVARSQPGAGRIVWKARTETPWDYGPQQLLVLDRALDSRGREWLALRLPIRPNGSSGWVRSDFLLVSRTPYWVDISLGRRLVSVYRSGEPVKSFRAVVGAAATPTPTGLAAIYDIIPEPSEDGFEGPWILYLTAFSNVLGSSSAGGGRIGIHGRGGASLRDPLGSARSHGCIRVNNAAVSWLARRVPRGTPIDIHD